MRLTRLLGLFAQPLQAVLLPTAILLVAGCATRGGPEQTVDRAVTALGGEAALAAVRTVEATGTSKHWEPEQSHVAGGESRFAGDSSFTLQRDLAADATRIEWVRKLVYPGVREYRFTEILNGTIGIVQGVDTTGRTRQSLDSNPPSHTMSRFRALAMAREMQRTSPTLLLQMKQRPAQVTAIDDLEVGGTRYRALRYAADGRNFIVLFDASGLPARIRTLDYDSALGNSTYDLVLSDWREVGGVKVAHRLDYQLNGRTVIETRLDAVRINPSLPATAFAIPPAMQAAVAATAPTVTIPYQWVLRRQFIGVYLDSDSVSFDPRAVPGLRLQDVAPGVQLVQGATHNSMVVEMKDHLIVFDAPIDDAYSAWFMGEIARRYPGKPVRTLILSHHHMDHTGGARAYAAAGATVVVGEGVGAHMRQRLEADHSQSTYGAQPIAKVQVTEVKDRMVFTDGVRRVHAIVIDNPHSQGGLIGFVEDVKVGFVTDLWSPGREQLGEKLNAGQASIVAGVQKAGIAPERFAGGHGSVGNYSDLASRAGK
jgi:glyoxylase-like metal-dependent hydrolase (beta-lactamase superfamily II)